MLKPEWSALVSALLNSLVDIQFAAEIEWKAGIDSQNVLANCLEADSKTVPEGRVTQGQLFHRGTTDGQQRRAKKQHCKKRTLLTRINRPCRFIRRISHGACIRRTAHIRGAERISIGRHQR